MCKRTSGVAMGIKPPPEVASSGSRPAQEWVTQRQVGLTVPQLELQEPVIRSCDQRR